MLLHSDKYCVKFSFQAFSKIITLMSHQSKEVDLTLFDPSKDSERSEKVPRRQANDAKGKINQTSFGCISFFTLLNAS